MRLSVIGQQGPIVSPFIGLRAKPGGWREMHTGRNTYLLYCCECKVHALTPVPPDSETFVFRIMPKKDCTTEIKSICATHKNTFASFRPGGTLESVMFASEMHANKQSKTQRVSILVRFVKNTWIGATSRVACSHIPPCGFVYVSTHISCAWQRSDKSKVHWQTTNNPWRQTQRKCG